MDKFLWYLQEDRNSLAHKHLLGGDEEVHQKPGDTHYVGAELLSGGAEYQQSHLCYVVYQQEDLG